MRSSAALGFSLVSMVTCPIGSLRVIQGLGHLCTFTLYYCILYILYYFIYIVLLIVLYCSILWPRVLLLQGYFAGYCPLLMHPSVQFRHRTVSTACP